jgi:hypothetical protein
MRWMSSNGMVSNFQTVIIVTLSIYLANIELRRKKLFSQSLDRMQNKRGNQPVEPKDEKNDTG